MSDKANCICGHSKDTHDLAKNKVYCFRKDEKPCFCVGFEAAKPPKKYRKKENGKNDTGRPTSYDPKYCEEIIRYFDIEHYSTINTVTTGKNDYVKNEEKEVAAPLRFISGFARSIGVNQDTLQEWCRVHPQFSVAFTRAKELQQEMLVSNGLKGLYDARFAIFAAKNMTTMRDKIDIDHGITDESYEKMKTIPVAELLAEVQKLMPKK